MSDDFSSSTNWVSVGNGGVNISNGICNFSNVYNGSSNRVYRRLGATLSNSYWKSQCKFSILSSNPSGYGTSEHVIALTEGSLDYESSRKGIEVFITSASSTDNNINNWYFSIGYNKGGVYTTCTSKIYASSTMSSYFIRLERTAIGMTQLSIFSDSSFTTSLPGSPFTFTIDPTITGLNTIQHGTCTIGSSSRMITNATIDNDLICQDKVEGITSYNKNNNQIIIFPNPSGNYINIKFDGLSNETLKKYYIYNLQGAEVRSDILTHFDKINISNLLNGTYIIKFISDNEVYWGKFQKND